MTATLNTARRMTRRTTVLLGDARAVQTGRIGQRLLNRFLGRAVARAMAGVWR